MITQTQRFGSKAWSIPGPAAERWRDGAFQVEETLAVAIPNTARIRQDAIYALLGCTDDDSISARRIAPYALFSRLVRVAVVTVLGTDSTQLRLMGVGSSRSVAASFDDASRRQDLRVTECQRKLHLLLVLNNASAGVQS